MLKMMIADDEPIVLETLGAIIDWRQYDIVLVGTCTNGIDAYNMILDEYPDLVLMDITMPGLTGLELINRVRAIDDTIAFIIITGHESFAYARQAIENGVCEYLLKPCKKEQVLASVLKAKAIHEQQASLLALKSENAALRLQIERAARGLYLKAVFQPDNPEILEEAIAAYGELLSSPKTAGYAIVNMRFSRAFDRNTICALLDAQMRSVSTRPFTDYLFTQTDAIFAFRIEYMRILHDLRQNLSYDQAYLSRGCAGVEINCYGDAFKCLHALQVLLAVQTQTLCCVTKDGSETVLRLPVAGISVSPPAPADRPEDDMVHKINTYVAEHLSDENLSLKYLAENILYMNINYVSRRYFKLTGEKFSNFIGRLRVERAKEALAKLPTPRIADVAQQVGMGDNPQYFSQVFKRYIGQTPTQFVEGVKRP